MELFELKEYQLIIAPQALALTPFKVLFDADKSKGKDTALMEMSYIYFFCDGRSDFADILDKDIRHTEISKNISLPKDWKPSKIVQDAIEFYTKREIGVLDILLEDSLIGAEKLGKHLRNIDLNERDEKSNKPIHNPKQIQDVLTNIPRAVNAIITAKREIKKDKELAAGARGTIVKGMFEDVN